MSPRQRRLVIWGAVIAIIAGLLIGRVATIHPRLVKAYLADEKPVVLGHQGASGERPSNTIESFKRAEAVGADILELDVSLTKDGVVVVSHDTSIDRMSNGKGQIKDHTFAELQTFDFGYGFTPDDGKTHPFRNQGIKIPTLAEVFEKFPGKRVNIEIKQVDPPMEHAVWDVVRKYGMEDKILINSLPSGPTDRWTKLVGERTAVSADQPDMYIFAAYWLPHLDWLYNPTRDCFQLPVSQKLGPFTIHLDTPRLINRAHKLGIKVHYWTVNDEATMRHLIEVGADGIITDFPDRAVKVLKEMGKR
jgi:glycerophosphoryl diester phosphodiesterase